MSKNFSRSWIMIPKTPKGEKSSLTCSPAAAKRSAAYGSNPLELYVPPEQAQNILQEIGLKKTNVQEAKQDKGRFNHYDSLGMTTAFFNNQEAEKEAKKRMKKNYEFIPNFSWFIPTPQLDNKIPANEEQKWPLDSGVLEAHNRGITGQGVPVGVLDTGIDADHQEFAHKSIDFRYVPLFSESPADALPESRDIRGFDPGGHGTQVCGVIAGQNIGIAPDVDLYVGSVIDSETMKTSFDRVIQGLAWFMDKLEKNDNENKTAILNLSICFDPSLSTPSIPTQQAFDLVLKRLRKSITELLLNANVLPIAAIGNKKGKLAYPGAFQEVLGVGSIDFDKRLLSISGSGKLPGHDSFKPDLVGYGAGVRTCYERSITNNSVYKQSSGTSIASAYVTGIAALYCCQEFKQNNRWLSVDELRNKIMNNVLSPEKLSSDNSPDRIGKGLVRFVP